MKKNVKKDLRKIADRISNDTGLTIILSENKQFPFFVKEWDECSTEEEIYRNMKDEWDFANIVV